MRFIHHDKSKFGSECVYDDLRSTGFTFYQIEDALRRGNKDARYF
jgi:hypothetical protein